MSKKEKPSFILYGDLEEHLCEMSDEEWGRLFRAIFGHVNRGELTDLSGELKMAFKFICGQIDRDTEKWEETCRQRAIAGKKGADKRWGGGDT